MHVMKPDVASVIQDHADAFVGKVAEAPGTSQDVYVNIVEALDLPAYTELNIGQVLLHCFALDGITGHLFYPQGLHSLTDPSDLKIMQEMSYSSGLIRAHPILHTVLPSTGDD